MDSIKRWPWAGKPGHHGSSDEVILLTPVMGKKGMEFLNHSPFLCSLEKPPSVLTRSYLEANVQKLPVPPVTDCSGSARKWLLYKLNDHSCFPWYSSLVLPRISCLILSDSNGIILNQTSFVILPLFLLNLTFRPSNKTGGPFKQRKCRCLPTIQAQSPSSFSAPISSPRVRTMPPPLHSSST